MKVSELIEKLKMCKQDSIVVMSRDAEGNGYESLRIIEDDMMFSEIWGDIRYAKLTPELEECGYSEEDILDPSVAEQAVVLYP